MIFRCLLNLSLRKNFSTTATFWSFAAHPAFDVSDLLRVRLVPIPHVLLQRIDDVLRSVERKIAVKHVERFFLLRVTQDAACCSTAEHFSNFCCCRLTSCVYRS